MSDHETNFLNYAKALKEKNYELQTRYLLLINDTDFVSKLIGSYESWSTYEEHGVHHWSVLTEAAITLDPRAIEMVLNIKRFSTIDFIKQAVKALDEAIKISQNTQMDESRFNTWQLQKAKVVIIEYVEKHAEKQNFSLQYSDQDKKTLQENWSEKINTTKSIYELLTLYENLKDKQYIVQRRHEIYDNLRSGLGFFLKPYPNRQIAFIEQCHEKALQLLSASTNITEEAAVLLQSDLFNQKHFKNGVKTWHIYENIQDSPNSYNALVMAH